MEPAFSCWVKLKHWGDNSIQTDPFLSRITDPRPSLNSLSTHSGKMEDRGHPTWGRRVGRTDELVGENLSVERFAFLLRTTSWCASA